MKDLHKTQLGILKQLLFAKTLRYSDLKTDPELENNTFQFHIDKMINDGYVSKEKEGYSLTTKGKKFANHIDTDKDEVVHVKETSAHIYCIRGEKRERGAALLYPFEASILWEPGRAKWENRLRRAQCGSSCKRAERGDKP